MTVYSIDVEGRILDGFERKVQAAMDMAKYEVADAGLNLMHRSAEVFRYERPSKAPGHPGYWESQLSSDRVGDNREVSDNAIYNCWLEGTSSRNQTSRFKGYRIWRQARQQLRQMAGPIARAVFARVF